MKRILLIILLSLWGTVPAVAANPLVLVIESYHSANPWDQSYLAGFKAELGSN